MASGNSVAYIGIVALILSALLTALYIFYIVVRAYFPRNKEYPAGYYDHVHDPNLYMTGTLVVLAAVSVIIGFYPGPLIEILNNVALGLI